MIEKETSPVAMWNAFILADNIPILGQANQNSSHSCGEYDPEIAVCVLNLMS